MQAQCKLIKFSRGMLRGNTVASDPGLRLRVYHDLVSRASPLIRVGGAGAQAIQIRLIMYNIMLCSDSFS